MIPFNTARWIDRRIGQPVCTLVALLRFLRGRKVIRNEKIRKILVIKMWGIGTIVLASPVLRNLKRNCPQCQIFFMTLLQNKGIYEGSPYVHEVVYFDMSSYARALMSFLKLVAWMWRQRFDLVFDFEIGSRFTALLTFLSYNSMTVGYAPAGSGKNIFDITIPYIESSHMTRIYLRSLDLLQMKIYDQALLPLPITRAEIQRVDHFLDTAQIGNFVVFNPNTSQLAIERLWPLARYGELGKRLLERFEHLKILIIGAGSDSDRVEIVLKQIGFEGRVIATAGMFAIRETTYLLSCAQVLVSNDSGPMHLGVLAGVPTIGLFGPETPTLYGPLGPEHLAITAGEICSPCISVYNDKVVDCHKGVICMKHIPVERVFDEVLLRLSKAHGHGQGQQHPSRRLIRQHSNR